MLASPTGTSGLFIYSTLWDLPHRPRAGGTRFENYIEATRLNQFIPFAPA